MDMDSHHKWVWMSVIFLKNFMWHEFGCPYSSVGLLLLHCILAILSIHYTLCDLCWLQFYALQVFKNHGASAGASMSHSHSQIMALPIVPPTVSSRLDCMKGYFEETGKCSVCEMSVKDLLIDESTHYISIIPFAATFPFEIWIVPRDHSPHFHEIDSEKVIINSGSRILNANWFSCSCCLLKNMSSYLIKFVKWTIISWLNGHQASYPCKDVQYLF